MNVKEFAKKYLNIELKEYQLRWLNTIKNMKSPTIILTRKGWMITDKVIE